MNIKQPKKEILLLGALLFVFVLASLVLLPVPFTRDQGIYAYNGWRWLADETLYADCFGHKGPLLYIIYAAGLNLSGGAMWGINLIDIVSRGATIVFTYLVARETKIPRVALLAALFTALPLAGVFNSCWWNAQAETFMLPALAGSAWLCLRFRKKGTWWAPALAGVIAAQAVMLKWSGVAHVAFLYLWLIVASRPNERPQENQGFLSSFYKHGLGAGFLVAVAAWLVYLSLSGALSAMWESAVVFNSFHGRAAFAEFDISTLGLYFQRSADVFSFLPLCVLGLLLKNNSRRLDGNTAFALLWLVAALLQLFSQARFFLYHYLVIIPPLAFVAALGMERAWKKLEGHFPRKAAGVAAALFLLALVFVFGLRWHGIARSYQTFSYLGNQINQYQYWSRFSEDDRTGTGDFNLLASSAAAAYARENSAPSSTLLVFGYEPLVNYMTGRPAPTRFQIDYPLTFEPRSEKARRYRERFREQFMRELKKDPPELVALVDNDVNAVEPLSSLRQAKDFKRFWRWISKNYRPAQTVEDFHFYRIKKNNDD